MNIKTLIGILNRPWAIEPKAAVQWSNFANHVFETGSIPIGGLPNKDKRKNFQNGWGIDGEDDTVVFRVDDTGTISTNGSIQVIRMDAPITKYDFCGSPGSQSYQQMIVAANADTRIKSIILWIDSPGGQVDGTESLANTIKNSTKPIIAYADGLMASAAYWIGSSANEVIADGSNAGNNTSIGSIGTMCRWYDNSQAMEQAGIKEHIVFADASSDKWGDYFKMNAGDYTDLIANLNALNDTFLSAVKSNRDGKLKLDIENVLSGKVYSAKQALKFGLIDSIGDFQTAVKRASALSTIANSKSNNKMQNSKLFQLALIAACAESFAVSTEAGNEGFVLSEANVNSIGATLGENATEIAALKAQNKALQEQLSSSADAAALTAATAQVATLTQELATANQSLATAQEELAAEKKKPAGSVATTDGEEDLSQSAKEAQAVNNKFDAVLKESLA